MLESSKLEYKSQLQKSILKEIVAFANTNGGKILLGYNDDGQIIGLNNIKDDQEKLSSWIVDGIKPSLIGYIDISIETMDKGNTIVIEIQRGDGRPYYLSEKGMKPSGIFKRLGNTSVPVSDTEIRDMIIGDHGTSYESTRSFNQNLTFEYATKRMDELKLPFGLQQMKSLGFVDEDGLYTNLALLISDQCPHIIKAAVFKDDSKMFFSHRQTFDGSLLRQLDMAYEYLEMLNHLRTSYEGLRRVDHYEFPQVAIREGLLNAIVHRDYGISGDVFINVYLSSMEFISFGGLPSGMGTEELHEGVSMPRNRRLAQYFYRLELIEAFGTGIAKIFGSYSHSSRQPIIKITPNTFILRLPKIMSDTDYGTSESLGPNRVGESSIMYQEDETRTINLKDRQAVLDDIILMLESSGNMTRKDLQSRYGFSQTKCGTLIKSLEEQKLIVAKGSGKNRYYVLAK